METNNFAFDVKVTLGLESTILDGVGLPACLPACRPACLPDGEAGIKTSYSPTGLGLGLSLAIGFSDPMNNRVKV